MTDHVSTIPPPLAVASVPEGSAADMVSADGWWPAISIAEFRAVHRVSNEITEPRVRKAIRSAIQAALNDLSPWGVLKRAEGFTSLEAVPAVTIDGVSHFVLCWQSAVTALAKAELAETHRDYDATASGERKGKSLDETIIELRRDAAHAIRDLLGRSRVFSDLI